MGDIQVKLDLINSLEVLDYSCTGAECEYVLIENSDENRKALVEAGISEELLDEATVDEEIDVAMIAFSDGADWYDARVGFVVANEVKQVIVRRLDDDYLIELDGDELFVGKVDEPLFGWRVSPSSTIHESVELAIGKAIMRLAGWSDTDAMG